MRLGEVTGLTWDVVNFEKNCITINKQVGRIQNFAPDAEQKTQLCLRNETKTSSSNRTISIDPRIMAKVNEHKTAQDKHIKKWGAVYNNLNMVFCREDGNLIDPKTFRTFFINTLKKAGIEEKKFHALRHTFATRALDSNINAKTVSEILGHSSIKITMDTYSHVSQGIRKLTSKNELPMAKKPEVLPSYTGSIHDKAIRFNATHSQKVEVPAEGCDVSHAEAINRDMQHIDPSFKGSDIDASGYDGSGIDGGDASGYDGGGVDGGDMDCDSGDIDPTSFMS